MVNASDGISILQLTDTHIMADVEDTLLGVKTAHYFDAVVDAALSSGRQFDLCLVTGDIAQDPCLASYQYVLRTLQRLDCPCLCLPGNHDDFEIMESVFRSDRINCRKQLFLGNWQVIGLNSQVLGSAGGYLEDVEFAFLEHCLSAQPKHFALIAVHHHCVSSGSAWMDTMIIGNAKALLDIAARHPNAKVIINGHIHQVMDSQQNSVRILSAPSTCFQFKPLSKQFSLDETSPGYRWLTLHHDGSFTSGITRIPEQIMGLKDDPQGY